MRHLALRLSLFLTCVAIAATTASSAQAQDVALGISDRAPRFFVNASPEPVALDASRNSVLRRRITVDFNDTKLGDALEAISRQSGLRLMYSWTVIPVDRRVTLKAEGISVAGALSEILLDAGVDVLFERDGQAAIIRRGNGAPRAAAGTIAGRVIDATTLLGIEGARVSLEGTRSITTTSSTGNYRLAAVPAGAYTLVIRRLGYKASERAVTVEDGREVTVDVALQPVPGALDEVVVTVTGDQRLRELGHAVGRINADSLVKESPVASLSELLTARVPGLQVFQAQGTVGGDVRVRIRGPNFLDPTGQRILDPVVIIDGMRYTTRSLPTGIMAGPGFRENSSPLNDINPNEIESIDVIKGPSAVTLYGTDAANGVIVITTKRGQPGPARWNVYAKTTTNSIPTFRYPDIYYGWGRLASGAPYPSNCTLRFLENGFCAQQDSITVIPNPLNDPQYTILGSKPRYEYGINATGGQQALRYVIAADFEDATGPIQLPPALAEQLKLSRGLRELPKEWREPNAFTKLNLRGNTTAALGQTADLDIRGGYVRGDTRTLGIDSPFLGSFEAVPGSPYGTGSRDPAQAFVQTSNERVDRFLGNASGQWRPMPWLAARATVGLDLASSYRFSLARPGDAPGDNAARNGQSFNAR